MYEQVFGFKNRPFTSTPYVQNYFPGDSIHHALSQLRLTIERAAGPAIVTGASGTGKSLLLAMLNEYFKNDYQVISLVCANVVERRDLLQSLLFEIQLPYRNLTEGELRLSLIDYLKSQNKKQNGILLLVDEAHSLSAEILDELRVITNFSNHGRPVISLVMAGLASLEDHLIETKSESLNQRIAARCYLSNLSRTETFDYIVTHLERAGGNGETIFTADAIKTIYEFTDGCPRVINQICDYALVLAASQNTNRVSAEIAAEAWNDVQSIPGVSHTLPDDSITEKSDMMVLEFGQLESDDSSIEFGSLDSDEEPTIYPVHVEADHSDTPPSSEYESDDGFEYKLQSIDDENFVDSLEVEPQPHDFDFSITDDNVQDDRLHSFENPFDEPFEEEESVYAAFVPEVSEQNIKSLMVTSEQLYLLESIDSADNTPSSIEQDDELTNVDLENDELPLDYQDLRITPEALQGLEQVEEDVRQLQRDLMFTEREFSSQAVHPDYEFCDQQQPIEELFQQHTISDHDESICDGVTNENSDSMDQTEYSEDSQTVQFENEIDIVSRETSNNDCSDDRDMMVISQPERFNVEQQDETDYYLDEGRHISTGNARRMDYKDLFQQLRSAN